MLQASARLVDISERGARVESAMPRNRGSLLWLGLESLPMEWVRARVVAMDASAYAASIHLSFEEPCPPGLLEWAIRTVESPASGFQWCEGWVAPEFEPRLWELPETRE